MKVRKWMNGKGMEGRGRGRIKGKEVEGMERE